MSIYKENHDWPFMIYVYHKDDNKWYPFIGYDTMAECSLYLEKVARYLRPAKIVKQEVIASFDAVELPVVPSVIQGEITTGTPPPIIIDNGTVKL